MKAVTGSGNELKKKVLARYHSREIEITEEEKLMCILLACGTTRKEAAFKMHLEYRAFQVRMNRLLAKLAKSFDVPRSDSTIVRVAIFNEWVNI